MDLSMTAPPTGWVPVQACTLPTAEQPLRVAEFDELFATSLRAVERLSATRVRLVLSDREGLDARVRELVEAESSCCSFFTFTLTRPDSATDVVTLEIEVPTAQSGVLTALVERAELARRATS